MTYHFVEGRLLEKNSEVPIQKKLPVCWERVDSIHLPIGISSRSFRKLILLHINWLLRYIRCFPQKNNCAKKICPVEIVSWQVTAYNSCEGNWWCDRTWLLTAEPAQLTTIWDPPPTPTPPPSRFIHPAAVPTQLAQLDLEVRPMQQLSFHPPPTQTTVQPLSLFNNRQA